MTLLMIYITLALGFISILVVATNARHKKGKGSPENVKEAKRRVYPPEFTSIPSDAADEREKMVDYLLKRKHLTLDEKRYIYVFLMDTGKEKWRYIEGYWGYYRISSAGMVESCRRHNYLDPSERNKGYQVILSVNGEVTQPLWGGFCGSQGWRLPPLRCEEPDVEAQGRNFQDCYQDGNEGGGIKIE